MKTLLMLFVFASMSTVWAARAISVEAGGAGGFYSINYEQTIAAPYHLLAVWGRAGVSYSSDVLFDVPLGVTAVLGTRTHRLELGAAVTPEFSFEDFGTVFSLLVFPEIAWRIHPRSGPLFIRLAVTPAWEPFEGRTFGWGAAGAGYEF